MKNKRKLILISVISMFFIGSIFFSKSQYVTKLKGDEYPNKIYENIILRTLGNELNKTKILNSDYIVEHYNPNGILIKSENFNYRDIEYKIYKSCQNIHINNNDLYVYARKVHSYNEVLPDNVVYGEINFSIIPFVKAEYEFVALENKKTIQDIKECTLKVLSETSVDNYNLARFFSDDRFEKFKSEKLDGEIKKSLIDDKLTWAEMISLYSELYKDINLNILKNFNSDSIK